MAQHLAAQEYVDLALRLDKVLETIEILEQEMTSIQNELIRNSKLYNKYEKEVFEFLVSEKQRRNPDCTLEELQTKYKKCIKSLGIKVNKDDIRYLAEEPVSMLAYYVTEVEKE